MAKIKVLQVVGQLTIGGQETMVMNYYRFMNRPEIEFDFLVYGDTVGAFEEEAISMGASVIHVPPLKDIGYIRFINTIKSVLKKNGPYNVIHSHTSFNSGFFMRLAKQKHIPIRITHSHTTNPGKKSTFVFRLYSCILRQIINNNATHLIGCGNEAGAYLFGKDVFEKKGQVIKNGIEVDKFTFETSVRANMRAMYDLENKFVVGHIGRLSNEKNHSFLLDIFSEIVKRNPESILFIVGTGPLLEELKSKSILLKIDNNVIFTGQRSDIPNLLQLMDVFVFTSYFEGMPVSVVEAQSTGLPCIVSKNVTPEIKVTDLVEFIGLEQSPSVWAERVLETTKIQRKSHSQEIKNSGFDIVSICNQLENLYQE